MNELILGIILFVLFKLCINTFVYKEEDVIKCPRCGGKVRKIRYDAKTHSDIYKCYRCKYVFKQKIADHLF